jgi:hypothetical protein
MAVARDRKRSNVRGGGKLYLRELSPTPSNTLLDVGYIKSTDFINEHTMVELFDETGNFIDNKSGQQKVVLNVILQQSSIDEINLLNNASGKYYELYYKNPNLANTYVQEVSIPIGVLKPGVTLKMAAATERTIELNISCLAPKADYVRGVTTFNVSENVPFIITETATAQYNTSNTEASAMATAIL